MGDALAGPTRQSSTSPRATRRDLKTIVAHLRAHRGSRAEGFMRTLRAPRSAGCSGSSGECGADRVVRAFGSR
jgi:hypothetical protein